MTEDLLDSMGDELWDQAEERKVSTLSELAIKDFVKSMGIFVVENHPDEDKKSFEAIQPLGHWYLQFKSKRLLEGYRSMIGLTDQQRMQIKVRMLMKHDYLDFIEEVFVSHELKLEELEKAIKVFMLDLAFDKESLDLVYPSLFGVEKIETLTITNDNSGDYYIPNSDDTTTVVFDDIRPTESATEYTDDTPEPIVVADPLDKEATIEVEEEIPEPLPPAANVEELYKEIHQELKITGVVAVADEEEDNEEEEVYEEPEMQAEPPYEEPPLIPEEDLDKIVIEGGRIKSFKGYLFAEVIRNGKQCHMALQPINGQKKFSPNMRKTLTFTGQNYQLVTNEHGDLMIIIWKLTPGQDAMALNFVGHEWELGIHMKTIDLFVEFLDRALAIAWV